MREKTKITGNGELVLKLKLNCNTKIFFYKNGVQACIHI